MMTVCRFNYTGKERIDLKYINIKIYKSPKGNAEFTAKVTLDSYSLPPNAKVFIEAYRKTLFKRFNFGTVNKIAQPSDTSLKVFDYTKVFYLELK